MSREPPSGKRLRKSLSHVGGAARFSGDERLRALLERAATPGDEDERALTHGFHPWPGRLHPHTARELIAAAPPGLIADPFMGAGTVPLEAMLAGRAAIGNDLNPIGVEVAWVRTRRFSPAALSALVARAKAVTKKADRLVADGARVEPGFQDRVGRWFDRQALVEVWAHARCLAEGDPAWPGSPGDPLTRVLRMALSSILVKASRQVSDSVAKLDRHEPAPSPPGRIGHWLRKRVSELAGQLGALSERVEREVPEPILRLGDARVAPEGAPPIAAVVSSPPYPGVYDYVTHHALRCAVLGFETAAITENEIGSRRASERLGKAVAHARYVEAMGAVLASWTRTLAPGGFVALVIGDGQIGTNVVRVMPLLERAAEASGLAVRAIVSQARPTFGPARAEGRGAHKEEHLVWLEPPRLVAK